MSKTVIEINGGPRGSTALGRLIDPVGKPRGYKIYNAFPLQWREDGLFGGKYNLQENEIRITGSLIYALNQRLGKYTGLLDCYNYFTTKKFDWVDRISVNGYETNASSFCLKTGENKISFFVK